MTDNIDEQPIDNQINDTEPVNQNQVAENMEVHHHAHHEHGKRN